MQNPPTLSALESRVREIFVETLRPDEEVRTDRSLIEDLGFDSLDIIELSFALEEGFGFEFSSRNAIEELDRRVGDNRILAEGCLTALGRSIVIERMPELAAVSLPEELRPAALPAHFTLQTFTRILYDFYLHAPDVCPETLETTVVDDFLIVSETSRQPVHVPSGDDLLEQWLQEKMLEITAVKAV